MNLLKNLKVSMKIVIIIIASILSLAGTGIYSYFQLTNISYDIEDIYKEKFIPNNWISDAIQINLQIDSILIQMVHSNSLEEKQQLHNEINNGVEEVLSNFAVYENMDLSDEEINEIANFYKAVDALTGNQDDMIEFALAGNNEAALQLFEQIVQDARSELILALSNLNKIKQEQTKKISESNIALVKSIAKSLIISTVIIALVLFILGYFISNSITKPLNILRSNMETAQSGNLVTRKEYSSKDEIGQVLKSFDSMMDSIKLMMEKVQISAEQVNTNSSVLLSNISQTTSTSEHVVSAIQEITSGSEQTKHSLENNNSILNKVETSVKELTDELTIIEKISKGSINEAQAGTHIVLENVKQMELIQTSVQQSNELINNLSNQVGEVDNILQVVNSISEQTNLLALNAAIEAARAAEHGRGFAVVADEVRKLAEQSLNSTKSIAMILGNIKKETGFAVTKMNVILEQTNQGLSNTNSTKDKFDDILHNTNSMAPLIVEMKNTVQLMNDSLGKFVSNAEEILVIAVNNAASTEEVSASTEQQLASMEFMKDSAQDLAMIANQLNKVMSQFKIS